MFIFNLSVENLCIPAPAPPGIVPTGTPPPQGVDNPPCPVGECGLFSPGSTSYSCPRGFAVDNCGCQANSCQCGELDYIIYSKSCVTQKH